MKLPFWCAPVVLLICVFCAVAEDAPTRSDPQNTYEPRSEPGIGQEFLKKFVGDWAVVKTFHPRAGDPVVSNGNCRQTLINDGRFLMSEFKFEDKSGPATGLGLLGYDSQSGLFTSVWTDSRSTHMSFRKSMNAFDGKTIELFGASIEESATKGHKSKTLTTLEDDGRKIVHVQYRLDPMGKPIGAAPILELVLTRMK